MSKPDALALADRIEVELGDPSPLSAETMAEAAEELRRLHAAAKRGQRAEQLLREAVPYAEWREKRIYGLGPQVYQSWMLEVQLLIPADFGMRPEQALERALKR